MDLVLQFFEPREFLPWLGNVMLFTLASIAFLWLIGMVLARLPIVVKADVEMKIHFGMSIALLFYAVTVTLLAIRLALEYKRLDLSLLYALPFCILVAIAVVLIFGLNGQINTRIAAHSERKSLS